MLPTNPTSLSTYIARGYDLRKVFCNIDGIDLLQAEVVNTQDGTVVASSNLMPYNEQNTVEVVTWARLVAHGHKISFELFHLARVA